MPSFLRPPSGSMSTSSSKYRGEAAQVSAADGNRFSVSLPVLKGSTNSVSVRSPVSTNGGSIAARSSSVADSQRRVAPHDQASDTASTASTARASKAKAAPAKGGKAKPPGKPSPAAAKRKSSVASKGGKTKPSSAGSAKGKGGAASAKGKAAAVPKGKRATSAGSTKSNGSKGKGGAKSNRTSMQSTEAPLPSTSMTKRHSASLRGGSIASCDDLGAAVSTGSMALRLGRTTMAMNSRGTAAISAEELQEREMIFAEESVTFDLIASMFQADIASALQRQVRLASEREQNTKSTLGNISEELRAAMKDTAEKSMKIMLQHLSTDKGNELERLRAENMSLKETMERYASQLEEGASESRELRDKMVRISARSATQNEGTRAEIRATLRTARFDVDKLKKDLAYRIDVATSNLFTPKYNTSLQEFRDNVNDVQHTIQEHSDTLHFLIESIGAKNTFDKDESETMHTDYPIAFRDALRSMTQDQLLNILDIVSFQPGVVECVGRALYILRKQREEQQGVN